MWTAGGAALPLAADPTNETGPGSEGGPLGTPDWLAGPGDPGTDTGEELAADCEMPVGVVVVVTPPRAGTSAGLVLRSLNRPLQEFCEQCVAVNTA